jgi:hypothetical protein
MRDLFSGVHAFLAAGISSWPWLVLGSVFLAAGVCVCAAHIPAMDVWTGARNADKPCGIPDPPRKEGP